MNDHTVVEKPVILRTEAATAPPEFFPNLLSEENLTFPITLAAEYRDGLRGCADWPPTLPANGFHILPLPARVHAAGKSLVIADTSTPSAAVYGCQPPRESPAAQVAAIGSGLIDASPDVEAGPNSLSSHTLAGGPADNNDRNVAHITLTAGSDVATRMRHPYRIQTATA